MTIVNNSDYAQPSSDEIAAAVRILRLASDTENRVPACNHKALFDPRLSAAKLIRRVRRSRSELLDSDLFGEASWDILLALYVAHRMQYRVTVTAVCSEANVPLTTALRWLQHLVDKGLVQRRDNPLDRRTTFVELSSKAVLQMDSLMDTVLNLNT